MLADDLLIQLNESFGGILTEGVWSETPIRDTSCCGHSLTDVPYLRLGPHRGLAPAGLARTWGYPPAAARGAGCHGVPLTFELPSVSLSGISNSIVHMCAEWARQTAHTTEPAS